MSFLHKMVLPMVFLLTRPTTAIPLQKTATAEQVHVDLQLPQPAAGTWTRVADFPVDTFLNQATTLPNGDVMVAGGVFNDKGVQIYTTASNEWRDGFSMKVKRQGLCLVALQNGEVLAAGGYGEETAEVWNFGGWSSAASMNKVRYGAGGVALKNGKVLVTGGSHYIVGGGGTVFWSSCEMYDPATGSWTDVAHMNQARHFHASALLANGSVIVVGGSNPDGYLASVERYDPDRDEWTLIGDTPVNASGAAMWTLKNNSLLLCGGSNQNTGGDSRCWVLLSTENRWTAASAELVYGLSTFGSTSLNNGSCLMVGGRTTDGLGVHIARFWTPPDSPSDGSYRCIEDQCVATDAGTGVPKDECDSFCGSDKYLCEGGRCVESTDGTGTSKEACDRICRPEFAMSHVSIAV